VTTTTAVEERTGSAAQLTYYAGWVVMFLVESVAWVTLGIVLGIVAFVLVGTAWGLWQARQTSVGEQLRGPILRLTKRLIDRSGLLAFVAALILGGPPGVAAAAASSDRRDLDRLVVGSSVLYAALCVAFHVLRPQGGVPIHLGPTLPGH